MKMVVGRGSTSWLSEEISFETTYTMLSSLNSNIQCPKSSIKLKGWLDAAARSPIRHKMEECRAVRGIHDNYIKSSEKNSSLK